MFGWKKRSIKQRPDVPVLTTFKGWLRSHRAEYSNLWGRAALGVAFPGFDPPVWTEEQKEAALKRASQHLSAYIFQTANLRRFAGFDLSRGSYYSRAVDQSGLDYGTLCSELRAYRSRTDHDMIASAVDGLSGPESFFTSASKRPNALLQVKNSTVMVSIYPASRLRVAVEYELANSDQTAADLDLLPALTDERVAHVLLLPEVNHYEIAKVVDLRIPQTRDSFFEVFGTGKEIEVVDGAPAGSASFWRPLGNNITEFRGMIPELIDPHIGGTSESRGVTQQIGDYLRAKGVSALIYPSARNDSFAIFEDGRLTNFGGWNLVDFRGSSPDPELCHSVMMAPWHSNSIGPLAFVSAPANDRHAGSFTLDGLTKANEDAYERRSQGRSQALRQQMHGCEDVVFRGSIRLDEMA
jgi:hypothetical protein